MAASSSTPTLSKVAYCLQNAQAAKSAGTAALQANNLRNASFQYKRVYLYLAEYLPQEVTGPSRHPSSPSSLGGGNTAQAGAASQGHDDGGNSGLVQLLQQRRRPPPPSTTDGSQPSSADAPSSPSPEQLQEMLQLYATTLNNLALVHLKLGRYREGVTCATAILTQPKLRAALDATQKSAEASTIATTTASSVAGAAATTVTPAGRALLRRASCFVKLSAWAEAETDVQALEAANAAAHMPPDPTCAQLREAIQHGRKAEAEKEKKMMQRMFS